MSHAILRRVGVIGDVHTEADALAAALAALGAQGVDAILSVGDLVDGPLGEAGVDRCVFLLRQAQAIAIRGNHDRWLLWGTMRRVAEATLMDQLALPSQIYLAGLPETVHLMTSAGSLLLCHGIGNNDMVGFDDCEPTPDASEAVQSLVRPLRPRYVVHGHTHAAAVRQHRGFTFINAGTLHRRDRPGYVLVDFDTRQATFYRLSGETRTVVSLEDEWTAQG